MAMFSKQTLLPFARAVYHRLPLSQAAKWRLRARLQPVLTDLIGGQSPGVSLQSIGAVLRTSRKPVPWAPDYDAERALAAILRDMAMHAQRHGAPRVWLALPFLATGGAEWAALNLCRAIQQLRPAESVVLLLTDKNMVSERMPLPDGVLLVVLDNYLGEPHSYERKQTLLRDLVIAGRPHAFHNINSEVAWHLILAEGERLKRYTQLYASIFAFQFTPDHKTKIGYAAYFLKAGMPFLTGLLSDNRRFLTDAACEYELTPDEAERMAVLYQPCRLLPAGAQPSAAQVPQQRPTQRSAAGTGPRRPQFLWAGRLDAEKRVELFLEIVRRCDFADFRVFGQVVLDDGAALPSLPNLSYEGPFSSPLEWIERHHYDGFVFTSRWEGLPNILLEVGALGIPVVAPTVGGVGELVNETTGYPLPERPTADDYEQALRRVVANPHEAQERAQGLHALVQERHSWSNFVASVGTLAGYLSPLDAPLPVRTSSAEPGRPLVSVIVPCFNQGHYLYQSVTSALLACSHPMEVIVVDDGSSDPAITRQLVEAEQIAPGVVRIHRQKNQGLSGARNAGINLARGEYLQFLDADDVLAPGKIDAQVAQLTVNPALDVSVGNYLLCDESRGAFTKSEEAIARFDMDQQDFLYRWERGFVIPIHCGVFRRDTLRERRFDTHARAKEDWLFWTALSLAGVRFGYLQNHGAIYRQHDSSMRRSYVNMGQAWLQAGLKINEVVGEREPLFFESVVSWFEQCYRAHPHYREEIARRRTVLSVQKDEAPATAAVAPAPDAETQARAVAQAILHSLSSLPTLQERPAISVIIPIYGHFDYLQACLESVATQGEVPFEIVCVDDGSPDPRIAMLMDALRGRDTRLVVHREPVNRGISAVQNLAVEMARGDYVAFLDCDDALTPGSLKIVLDSLHAAPGTDYVFTDRLDVDEKGDIVRHARYGGYERLQFRSQDHIAEDLFDGMVASHLKVIRRSVYQAVGGCDQRYSGVQDWVLALRIARNHRLHYLAEPLYLHRVHTRSVTRSNNVAQMRKTNLVTREYLESFRAAAGGAQALHVFRGEDLPLSTAQLRQLWRDGVRCAVDVRGPANLGHINFLREFNAYFDWIAYSDPQVPASLYGYLCPDVALVLDIPDTVTPT